MAAYNNGFPMNYQQAYYPQYVQPQQQATQSNGIIWVQGEAGAKSYLVAPNNTVQLWDSEAQTIYLKSADASGMPSMKILDYKIRNAEQPAQQTVINNTSNYVTIDEFNSALDQIKNELKELKHEHESE